jgi:Cu-processing system permease protein
MRACLIIAAQEIRDGLRNKWILAAASLLTLFALSIAYLGSAPVGSVGASPMAVSVVSLSSLTVFLLPLLGLMMSYETIVGESERGTLFLLLSYPMRRWQYVVGKFIGHSLILMIAVLVGYGSAGLLIIHSVAETSQTHLLAYGVMMLSSIALGMVFIALGYLISALVRERGTAAGLALAVWLLFALVYDTVLLGLVIGEGGSAISDSLFNSLLVLNPTDAYRLLNLGSFEGVSKIAGLTGAAAVGTGMALKSIASMAAWILIPLAGVGWVFSRREF